MIIITFISSITVNLSAPCRQFTAGLSCCRILLPTGGVGLNPLQPRSLDFLLINIPPARHIRVQSFTPHRGPEL